MMFKTKEYQIFRVIVVTILVEMGDLSLLYSEITIQAVANTTAPSASLKHRSLRYLV